MRPPTPGQTIGPFYHYALPYPGDSELVPPHASDAIRFHGTVFDGNNNPVPDALLEIWQPAPDGSVVRQGGSLHRDGFTFTGWGRASTDNTGHFSFSTLRPGGQRPFFAVTVFARGLLDRLFTRAYLPTPDLAEDAFLATLEPARRNTLIATEEPTGFRFDVRLQGTDETVFLHFPGHRQGRAVATSVAQPPTQESGDTTAPPEHFPGDQPTATTAEEPFPGHLTADTTATAQHFPGPQPGHAIATPERADAHQTGNTAATGELFPGQQPGDATATREHSLNYQPATATAAAEHSLSQAAGATTPLEDFASPGVSHPVAGHQSRGAATSEPLPSRPSGGVAATGAH